MSKATSYLPPGNHTVTPYLVIKGADKAIEFYQKALGAEVFMVMPGPGGAVMHAELKIGDSLFYFAEESPGMSDPSPKTLGGTTVGIHLYVPDVDASFQRAVAAGATAKMPPGDMPWGDRFCKVSDPFGHSWTMATHLEDLTEEEVGKRMQAFMAQMGKGPDCDTK